MYKTIIVKEKDSHYEIILNRPEKLNALSPEMIDDLHAALKQLQDSTPKILLIRGEGGSFCSGHDLSTPVNFASVAEAEAELSKLQDITRLIVTYQAPVIAALHGYALGAGCEIALNCDLLYAAENAIIGFPELNVGLSITQGTSFLLPRSVGLYKAKEWIFYSRQIEAKEAYALGLINEIYKEDEFLDKVYENIEELKKKPIQSLGEIKKLFNKGMAHTLNDSLKEEIHSLIKLLNEVRG